MSENKKELVSKIILWVREYCSSRLDVKEMLDKKKIPEQFLIEAGKMGLLGMRLPKEYGGLELSVLEVQKIIEQISAIDVNLATYLIVQHTFSNPLLLYATPQFRAFYLPQIASGKCLGCFALSEPDAGANPRKMCTSIIAADRGKWKINGTKCWITGAASADMFLVFGHHEDEDRYNGISCFAIPKTMSGIEIQDASDMLSINGVGLRSIKFNNVVIGEEYLIGEIGKGMVVAESGLLYGRIFTATISSGIMKRCAQLMFRYASKRIIGTGALLDNPVTILKLKETRFAIRAIEAMDAFFGEKIDSKQEIPEDFAIACKVVSSELAWETTDNTVQLLGARGLDYKNSVARILADTRFFRIGEGPSEPLLIKLGATLALTNSRIMRYFRDEMKVDDTYTILANCIKEIKKIANDASMRKESKAIIYYAIGKVGMWSFLEAVLIWQQRQNSMNELEDVIEWAREKTIKQIGEARCNVKSISKKDVRLEKDLKQYDFMVGTIEETLPHSERKPDELLREIDTTDESMDSLQSSTTVIDLFEKNALNNKSSKAVICPGEIVSYGRLYSEVNALCQTLKDNAVIPGDVIGVIMDRSPLLATGLLAVLKSGAAILMLNANEPKERNQIIIRNANVKLIISVRRLEKILCDYSINKLFIDSDVDYKKKNIENIPNMATPSSTAYVAFTSGSTGVPKGVRVSHESICSQIFARCECTSICKEDKILHSVAPNFDIAIWETLSPFVYGCTLVLNNEDVFYYQPRKIVEIISELEVTHIQATPTQLALLLNNMPETFHNKLKCIFSGGEVLPDNIKTLFMKKLPEVDLVHLYGPTEAVIDTCYCKPLSEQDYVMGEIGKPFSNKEVYVLDENGEEVSDNIPGELYIGGMIAQDYLNDITLSAERFLKNRFLNNECEKMYRSGDIVKKLASGKLQFLYRTDQQIKVNGVRIELGEIEAVLDSYSNIKQAKAAAQKNKENSILVAYYTLKDADSINENDLRNYAAMHLPASMVPTKYIQLNEFPLTATGKINQNALMDLVLDEVKEGNEKRNQPNTVMTAVTKIWEEILENTVSNPCIDFFEIGGNSLMVIQVLTRIWELYAVEIDVIDFYENPTISGLCQMIMVKLGINDEDKKIVLDTKIEKEPLSGTQKNYWYMFKMNKNSAAYNCPEAVHFSGELNYDFLERSIREIISRHDALRTAFIDEDGEPYQRVFTKIDYTLSIIDVVGETKDEQEQNLLNCLKQESSSPFNLEEAPLFVAKLFRINKYEHVFFWNFHHIIADGWSSAQVFTYELNELYRAKCEGRESSLPKIDMQPIEYMRWQQKLFTRSKEDKQKKYWLEELKDAPSEVDISLDYNGNFSTENIKGHRINFKIPDDLYYSLKAFSLKEGVSNYNVLVAAYFATVHILSGSDDICIGTVVAGRKNSQIEQVIGNFANVVVLRTSFEPELTVEMLLRQVKIKTLKALDNSDIPFEEVVSAIKPIRDKNRNPLYNIFFSLFNGKENELVFPGLESKSIPMDPAVARLDLSLAMFEVGHKLEGYIEYKESLYKENTAKRVIKYFIKSLTYIVNFSQSYIEDMELVDKDEKELLCRTWNNTYAPFPKDKCMHELFEQQVERLPDKTAICIEQKSLTYKELNAKANRLAHYLRNQNIETGDFVGICTRPSIEMIVGILGIVKAGAAYVPIDPLLPEKRVAFILHEINSKIIVTQSEFSESLFGDYQKICLDTEWENLINENDINLNLSMASNQIIYMIYTSGSTGTPKAVRTMHYNVAALLCNTNHMCPTENDRFLKINNFAFDISTWEIWTPLIYGATMVIMPEEIKLKPIEFANFVDQHEITMAYLPTALFHAISVEIPSAFKKMKLLIVGGEALDPTRARAVLSNNPPKSFVNALGPTEVTCSSAWYEVNNMPEDALSVPIGRPVSNTQFYVLNSRMKVLPIGVTGELFIGGAGVSDGYHNRPELTKKNFLLNPFDHDEKFVYLYRSGDLVKYQEDGNLLSMGRKDKQIKIRGFRIEIGEIENAIREHEAVAAAAVLVKGEVQDEYQLVAYILLKPKYDKTIVNCIKDYLKKRLPYYMVPNEAIILDTMPFNKNGKIDRKNLASIIIPAQKIEAGERYPRNTDEMRLASIWKTVIGSEAPGIRSKFFEAGGDSLKAIRFLSLIKENFLVDLPVDTLFEYGSIEQLAIILREKGGDVKNKALLPFTLNSKTSQKTLFLVHPLSGSALCYRYFASLVSNPVIGLQQLGNSDFEALGIKTIEDLAKYYLRSIDAIPCSQPYLLGGWSMGGVVAFEMARQIEKTGGFIDKIILFDSAAPGKYQSILDMKEILKLCLKEAASQYGAEIDLDMDQVDESDTQGIYQMVLSALKSSGAISIDANIEELEELVKICIKNIKMLNTYKGGKINGDIILVHPQKSIQEGTLKENLEENFGWADMTNGKVQLMEVEGDHMSMMFEPYAKNMVTLLRDYLK